MWEFIRKHAAVVIGILSGFDRIVLRGTLRNLAFTEGMLRYLNVNGILLKHGAAHLLSVSGKLKAEIVRQAEAAGHRVRYLESPHTSKEGEARRIALENGVEKGLVCVLSALEPCHSFRICPVRELKRLVPKAELRKCLHYYFYWMHPDYGLMHARIQTWFPFGIQVCLNGREWLGRLMAREGLGFVKKDNCFTWLSDCKRAQELADEQLETKWSELLDGVAQRVNPLLKKGFGKYETKYYWSAYQTEWATDVMFKTPEDLAGLYARLVRHGMTTFKSPDVLRFLGQAVTLGGAVHGGLKREVASDVKVRVEGTRIKHRAGKNSVKMYDKQGSVLRVETTVNDARAFKVYRAPEGKPEDEKKWMKMRSGVADMHRRAHVSQASNERYLKALAAVEQEESLEACVAGLSRATELDGRRVRGLNIFGEDAKLLSALGAGRHALNGFRNRDLQESLYAMAAESKEERRRRSSRVTRQLRMLRAHKLVTKVHKTHRYQLTEAGRKAVVALSAAKESSVRKLTELAA